MVIKSQFFNSFLILFLAASPAAAAEALTPVNFKGIYALTFDTLRFGQAGIEVEQAPAHYTISCDVASTGVINMFVRHSSHTTVDGAGGRDFTYPDIAYETHYQTKKKPKYVKMVTQGGHLTELVALPPDANRPPLSQEMKDKAADPLSFLLRMRQSLWGLLHGGSTPKGGETFSLTVFDGRRLTQVNFTYIGKKTLTYNNGPLAVVQLDVRRKLAGGFTDKELSEFDPNEPVLHAYFSDDARLIPLKLEASPWFGTVAATLVKECRTGESCLLGNKD